VRQGVHVSGHGYRPLGAAGLPLGRAGWNGVGLGDDDAAGDGLGRDPTTASGDGNGLTATAGESGGRVGCCPATCNSGRTTDVAGTAPVPAGSGALQAAPISTMIPSAPLATSRLLGTASPPARDAPRFARCLHLAGHSEVWIVASAVAVHLRRRYPVPDVRARAASTDALGLRTASDSDEQQHCGQEHAHLGCP